MTEVPAQPAESRVVVTWAGSGQPIVLTLHGPTGEVSMPLTPTRALTLAQELIAPAIQSIKAACFGPDWPDWPG